jgi:hypothetical protein
MLASNVSGAVLMNHDRSLLERSTVTGEAKGFEDEYLDDVTRHTKIIR